jgi:hypothetical protein
MPQRSSVIEQAVGLCTVCAARFPYELIHNGFNESAYAYCDRCGITALFDGWRSDIPRAAHLQLHGPIGADVEPLLKPCACGGRFTASASPRCPCCSSVLDPVASASFMEANAPGAREGWRWQRTWSGLYAIIIAGRRIDDPWRASGCSDVAEA